MEWIILALVIYSVCLTIEFRQLEYNNNQLEKETKNLKPNTMTELPKEWLQEAEKIRQSFVNKSYEAEYSYMGDGFEQGATAYKQAVDRLLKDKIALAFVKSNLEPDLKGSYLQQASYYEQLLTELVSLKPTSND